MGHSLDPDDPLVNTLRNRVRAALARAFMAVLGQRADQSLPGPEEHTNGFLCGECGADDCALSHPEPVGAHWPFDHTEEGEYRSRTYVPDWAEPEK